MTSVSTPGNVKYCQPTRREASWEVAARCRRKTPQMTGVQIDLGSEQAWSPAPTRCPRSRDDHRRQRPGGVHRQPEPGRRGPHVCSRLARPRRSPQVNRAGRPGLRHHRIVADMSNPFVIQTENREPLDGWHLGGKKLKVHLDGSSPPAVGWCRRCSARPSRRAWSVARLRCGC